MAAQEHTNAFGIFSCEMISSLVSDCIAASIILIDSVIETSSAKQLAIKLPTKLFDGVPCNAIASRTLNSHMSLQLNDPKKPACYVNGVSTFLNIDHKRGRSMTLQTVTRGMNQRISPCIRMQSLASSNRLMLRRTLQLRASIRNAITWEHG